jgi:hypothetical protein
MHGQKNIKKECTIVFTIYAALFLCNLSSLIMVQEGLKRAGAIL